ncbi:MAG: hypothetical protein SGJ10_08060 [Bacteroidota bacterium]|nr:hypothetical protein [Bacteroidota bacterium]
MKYIIIVSIVFCFSCKNHSSEKGETEDSEIKSEQIDSKESPENVEQKESAENPMEELAGTWKQAPTGNAEVTGAKSLATIELNLKADGSFEGTEAMMNNYTSVSGNWRLEDGRVKLSWNGTELNMEIGSNNSTLIDSQNGISLSE